MMRPAILSLLSLVVLGACGALGVPCGKASNAQWNLAERRSPLAHSSADKYFSIFNTPLGACDAQYQRWWYVSNFFDGFRNPGSTINGEPSPDLRVAQAALSAGSKYREDNPNLVSQTYASFGYEYIEVEGVWERGFETSAFVSADVSSGQRWWLEPLARSDVNVSEGGWSISKHQVRLKGYISSPGRYGHLGIYTRKIYAISVRVVDAA
jgi:hypothetical protein